MHNMHPQRSIRAYNNWFCLFPFFLISVWLPLSLALRQRTTQQNHLPNHLHRARRECITMFQKKKKSGNVEWKQKRAKKLFLRCTNSVRCKFCTQSAQLLLLSPSLRYLCASHSLIISLSLSLSFYFPACCVSCVALCYVLSCNLTARNRQINAENGKNANELN